MLMILVKGQLTEKLVVYIVKTIFTVMEVSLLSPGNINICCIAIASLHCHPDYWWGHSHWCPHHPKYWWGYVPGIPGGVDAYEETIPNIWNGTVCWPRLTAKRVAPVVSISWASCSLSFERLISDQSQPKERNWEIYSLLKFSAKLCLELFRVTTFIFNYVRCSNV